MATGRRNGAIDTLRGVAIGLVLLHHFDIAYTLGPLHRLVRNGNYGVTMFFAVSGYLITGNALARWGALDRIQPARFYALRVARILPCLLLLLTIVNALGLGNVAMFGNHPEWGGPVSFATADAAALTLRINLLMAQAGWFNYALCVLWSLSVEEVFYAAFPLLALASRWRWVLVATLAGLVVLGPVNRALHADDENGLLYAYASCFDAIAIGCGAALLPARWRPRRMLVIAAGGGLAALLFAWPIWRTAVGGVSVGAVATAILLLASRETPARGAGPWRAVAWTGRHSYELYLFHLVVLGLLRTAVPRAGGPASTLLLLAVFLAGSMLLAALIASGLGRPANLALRRRWRADPAAQPWPAT